MSTPKVRKYASMKVVIPGTDGPKLSAKQKREVKRLISVKEEIKDAPQGCLITDVSSVGLNLGDGTTFSTTGAGATKSSLTQIGQGIVATGRIGEEVELKEFNFRYTIASSVAGILASGDRFNNMRVIIFRWLCDSNKNVPVVADILDTSGVNVPTLAPYARTNNNKYHICYDVTHVLQNDEVYNGSSLQYVNGPGSTYTTPRAIRLFGKKLGRKKVEYGSGINYGYGHVWGLAISDSSATNHPQIEFSSQALFTDS